MAFRPGWLLYCLAAAMAVGGCNPEPSPAASATARPSPSASAPSGPSPCASAAVAAPIGRIADTVSLPEGGLGPGGFAIDGSDVWVTDSGPSGGQVLRVHDGRIDARITVGWAPGSVAVGAGGVWVADTVGDGSRPTAIQNDVVRLDPTTGREVARIELASPGRIAIAGGAPWVAADSGSGGSTVDRIDPATNRIDVRIPVDGSITDVETLDGALWVASVTGDDTRGWLTRIDPSSMRRSGTLSLAAAPADVTLVGGQLWATVPGSDPSSVGVLKVDPAAMSVVGAPMETTRLVGSIASDGTSIWIVREGVLARLSPAGLSEMGTAVPLPSSVGPTVLGLGLAGSAAWILGSDSLVEVALE